MSEYAKIENYSGNGSLGISKKAFISIAEKATKMVKGVELKKYKRNVLNLAKPVTVSFTKAGRVVISISVDLAKNTDVAEVCGMIQEEVVSNISMMCDVVPVSVDIKVDKII